MKAKRNGYYDIEIDFEDAMVQNGLLEDLFYLKDLRQRKLFLNGGVDQFSVHDIVRHILQYNKEDFGLLAEQRIPITLYINSTGGDVDAGFELIDVIQASKTPVYTVNLGFWYSMGFLIGIAGHKRIATRNAKFLMHDGSNFVYNSGAKAQDQMEFNKRVEERVKQYILSRSRLTEAEYDSKLRVEWYMFADEAKQRGFVDKIIGDGCDIDLID